MAGKRKSLVDQRIDAAMRAAGPGARHAVVEAHALAPTLATELAGICSNGLLRDLQRVVTAATPPSPAAQIDQRIVRRLESLRLWAGVLGAVLGFLLPGAVGAFVGVPIDRRVSPPFGYLLWGLVLGWLPAILLSYWTPRVAMHSRTGRLVARMAYGVHLRSMAAAATWYGMTWQQFESNVAALMGRMGFDVTVTGGAGDKGVDMRAALGEVRAVVQCKKHEKPIGPSVVRELVGTLVVDRAATNAILVSCSGFSPGAADAARGTPVTLWALEDLVRFHRLAGDGTEAARLLKRPSGDSLRPT